MRPQFVVAQEPSIDVFHRRSGLSSGAAQRPLRSNSGLAGLAPRRREPPAEIGCEGGFASRWRRRLRVRQRRVPTASLCRPWPLQLLHGLGKRFCAFSQCASLIARALFRREGQALGLFGGFAGLLLLQAGLLRYCLGGLALRWSSAALASASWRSRWALAFAFWRSFSFIFGSCYDVDCCHANFWTDQGNQSTTAVLVAPPAPANLKNVTFR